MLSLSCSSCAATLLVLWTSVWTIRLIAFVKAEKFLQKVTPNLWPRIHCVMQRNAVTWAHYFSSSFHPLPSVLRRKYRKWKGGRGMPLMIEWVVDDPSTWLGIVTSLTDFGNRGSLANRPSITAKLKTNMVVKEFYFWSSPLTVCTTYAAAIKKCQCALDLCETFR